MTLTGFIKQLVSTSLVKKYHHIAAIADLPEAANAGGIRPGASNMLLKYMPELLATHITGHDCLSISAIFNYLDCDRAIAMVGAIVLANWPPLPWGQHGKGPVPASLQPLIKFLHIPSPPLEAFIDEVYGFDDASPPMLLIGGGLRPAVRCALAHSIMYAEDREKDKELQPVLLKMVKALTLVFKGCYVKTDLFEWGRTIKREFIRDNIHLTARKMDTSEVQMVQAMHDMASSLGKMTERVDQQLTVIHGELTQFGTRLTHLEEAVGQLRAAPAAPAVPTTPAPAASASAAARTETVRETGMRPELTYDSS